MQSYPSKKKLRLNMQLLDICSEYHIILPGKRAKENRREEDLNI